MHFTFWGVRGSIAAPGRHTVRHGGNTTCIEVRTDDDELIVLDAGTGIFPLGQSLLSQMPFTTHLFISHTHWDHIQGLPFFAPAFVAGNTLRIHGPGDPSTGRDIREVLMRQMEFAYFPVGEPELEADMAYHTLHEGQCIDVGQARVTNLLLGHPVPNFGYRIDCNGKSLVFTGDHEWPNGDDPPERRQAIIEFFRGADALIIDSTYTREEYPAKRGWGHGTFDDSLIAAEEAGVGCVYLTHHEPTRSDDELERVFALAQARHPTAPPSLLTQEGMTVEL
ncbi:MAG: MBL fold metallo-hydrolase [Ectothiorhodospiraceae bacterium]|jgi:phosphoribosyl 1,2-cyclic phosphodiesterase|nr:MBL fold metallo-hydrolase [Ectothiorhodospiraceae bacterium]